MLLLGQDWDGMGCECSGIHLGLEVGSLRTPLLLWGRWETWIPWKPRCCCGREGLDLLPDIPVGASSPLPARDPQELLVAPPKETLGQAVSVEISRLLAPRGESRLDEL